MDDILDDPSSTVLVVEVREDLGVPWTCPVDYPLRAEPNNVNSQSTVRWKSQETTILCERAVLADGEIREVSDGLSISVIARSGGEEAPDW